MLKFIAGSIANMIEFIVDIRWWELPKLLLYTIVIGGMGYCTALILIGFPISIWESITKKKVRDEVKDKVIRVVTVCAAVVVLLLYFA